MLHVHVHVGLVCIQSKDDWSYGLEGVPHALQYDGDGHDKHVHVPHIDESWDGGGWEPREQGRGHSAGGTGLSVGEGGHLGVREPPGFIVFTECHHHRGQ